MGQLRFILYVKCKAYSHLHRDVVKSKIAPRQRSEYLIERPRRSGRPQGWSRWSRGQLLGSRKDLSSGHALGEQLEVGAGRGGEGELPTGPGVLQGEPLEFDWERGQMPRDPSDGR